MKSLKSDITLEKMFNAVKEIEKYVSESELVEISVRQHQIALCLKANDMIFLSDILSLSHDVVVHPVNTFVTKDDKHFYIIIEEIDDKINESSKFAELICVIRYMAKHICQCPALEFTISPYYIKCFLDKPGIKLSEVSKLEELFGAECTLELGANRAYALFLNDNLGLEQ